MMSAEQQPGTSPEDDPGTLEILKDICHEEAMAARKWLLEEGYRHVCYERATRFGRALMKKCVGSVELIHDYFGPGFESKPFGLRENPYGDGLLGWTFSIIGVMPDAIKWSGKMPPEQAFAHFENSSLSIEKVIVGPDNGLVKRWPSGWMIDSDKKRFNIYEESEPLTIDKINELRVILETGLDKFIPDKQRSFVGSLYHSSLTEIA